MLYARLAGVGNGVRGSPRHIRICAGRGCRKWILRKVALSGQDRRGAFRRVGGGGAASTGRAGLSAVGALAGVEARGLGESCSHHTACTAVSSRRRRRRRSHH